eukprot:CAMPEP_0172934496 /NCGR_PEP_ID=MMETSP1075-20121228/221041_1 /TAXON_ID=2916 /ORGANISM="Ceratium fusus, Strain PA161109" /LENGTH=600 /DNA_ID=CAMNT_0013795849 /DNA_START=3 /DNA_END=1807 /DNA_ORIENTATION=-
MSGRVSLPHQRRGRAHWLVSAGSSGIEPRTVAAAVASPPLVNPPPLVATTLEGSSSIAGPVSPLSTHAQSQPVRPVLSGAKERALMPSLEGRKHRSCTSNIDEEPRSLAHLLQDWTATKGPSAPVTPADPVAEVISTRSNSGIEESSNESRVKGGVDGAFEEHLDEGVRKIQEALEKEVSERCEEDSRLQGLFDNMSARMDGLRKDFQGLMDLVLMELRCLVREAQVLRPPGSNTGGRHKRRASNRKRSSPNMIAEGGHPGPPADLMPVLPEDSLGERFSRLDEAIEHETMARVDLEERIQRRLEASLQDEGGHPGPPADLMPVLPEDSLGERFSRLDEAIEHETMARVDLEERIQRRLEASLQELRAGVFLNRGSTPNVLEEKLRSQPANSSMVAGQTLPPWHVAVKTMLEEHREKMPVDTMSSAERVRLVMPVLPEDSLGERFSRLDEAIEHETMARVDLEERIQRRLEASLQELRAGVFLNRGSTPNVLEEKLRSQPANSSMVAGQTLPPWHVAVKTMLEEHREKMPVDMMSSAERVRLRLVDCWKRNECAATRAKANNLISNTAKEISANNVISDSVKDISANNLISNNANEISAR